MDSDTKPNTPQIRFSEFLEPWIKRSYRQLFTIGSGRDYKHLKEGPIPEYGSGGVMNFVDQALHEGKSVGIGRKGTIDNPVRLNGKFWTVDTLFYTHSYLVCQKLRLRRLES